MREFDSRLKTGEEVDDKTKGRIQAILTMYQKKIEEGDSKIDEATRKTLKSILNEFISCMNNEVSENKIKIFWIQKLSTLSNLNLNEDTNKLIEVISILFRLTPKIIELREVKDLYRDFLKSILETI